MSPEKSPLTVVILAKNEAHRIGDCIKSASWADEVLVINDESTDDTVALSESLGAHVIHRKMDIEGRHRNMAYAESRNDWVFSLDADERITPELQENIKKHLENPDPAYTAYSVPLRNFIGKRWVKHGGWYPSPKLRLFLKAKFKYEEETVHPCAILEGECGRLEGDLLHYSYQDLTEFIRKINGQTTLEAGKWIRDQRKMSLLRATRKTLDRMLKSWLLKGGTKDGYLGLILATYTGMYQWMSYAKYYAKKQPINNPNYFEEWIHEANLRISEEARVFVQAHAKTPMWRIWLYTILTDFVALGSFCFKRMPEKGFTFRLMQSGLDAWMFMMKWAKIWELQYEEI